MLIFLASHFSLFFLFFLIILILFLFFFFFFNDTATTEIYTLSLHDALPICSACFYFAHGFRIYATKGGTSEQYPINHRSEEHTSELQSQSNLVCRLLLEKKKKKSKNNILINEMTMKYMLLYTFPILICYITS